MSRLIPYFIIAIGMVICAGMINYGNIAIELIVNTVMIVLFVIYAEYQDKFLSVFFRRNGNGNQYR
jgi:hypothetical protein